MSDSHDAMKVGAARLAFTALAVSRADSTGRARQIAGAIAMLQGAILEIAARYSSDPVATIDITIEQLQGARDRMAKPQVPR